MEGNFDLFEIVRLGSLGFTLHYFLFVLNLLKALKVFLIFWLSFEPFKLFLFVEKKSYIGL